MQVLSFIFLSVFLSSALARPYQAHSFNDLDYFLNLFLLKNTTYFKLDIALADRQSCTLHSTWPQYKHSEPPCVYYRDQSDREICCLGMRGDSSSAPSFDESFNTSVEFINTVRVALLREQHRKMFIVINFNFNFKWKFDEGLLQRFVERMAGLMKEFSGRLDVGFGGSYGQFVLEYDRVCRKNITELYDLKNVPNLDPQYQVKQIVQCTPARLEVSRTPFFLQSSSRSPYDPRDIFSRYRNFNVMFRAAQELCSQGFPSWINKYPQYPLLFWEPSDQRQIKWLIKKVMSEQCKRKHGRGIQGIAITSNLDPQMLQGYLKDTIEQISGQFIWDSAQTKLFLESAGRGVIASDGISFYAGVSKGNNKQIVLYMFKKQNSTNNSQQSVSSKFKVKSEKVPNLWGQFLSMQKIGDTLILVLHEHSNNKQYDNQYTKLMPFEGQDNKYHRNNSPRTINLYSLSKSSLEQQIYIPHLITQTFRLSQQTFGLLIYGLRFSQKSIKLNLKTKRLYQIIEYSVDKKEQKIWKEGFYIEGDDNNSFEVKEMKFTGRFGEGKIVILGDDGSQTKFVIVDQKERKLLNQAWVPLTYGTDAKIMQYSKTQIIFIVLHNSMCQSGTLINNNQINKCQIAQSSKYRNITNIPSVINLLQISLDNLLNFESILSFPITACTNHYKNGSMIIDFSKKGEEVRMGKVAQGRYPDLESLEDDGGLYIANKVVGIGEQGLFNGIFCGGSGYSGKTNGIQITRFSGKFTQDTTQLMMS